MTGFVFILILSIIFMLTGVILGIIAIDMFKRKNMIEVYDTLLNRGYAQKIAKRKARKEQKRKAVKTENQMSYAVKTSANSSNMYNQTSPQSNMQAQNQNYPQQQLNYNRGVAGSTAVLNSNADIAPDKGETVILNGNAVPNSGDTVMLNNAQNNSDFEVTTSITYTSANGTIE